MGVYVKGLTLDDLRIHLRGDDLEYLIAVGQATDVPDHGDLIDREAMMPKGEEKGLRLMAIGIENIESAPVIIPAERSEE